MKYVFIVLLGFQLVKGYCQEYVPGYIILTSGDTTYGFIELTSEAKGFGTCVFKKDSTAKPVTYSAYNLLAYGFNTNKFYKATEVISGVLVKRIFAEVLLDGTVSLLRYKTSYLVERKDSASTFILSRRAPQTSPNNLRRLHYNQLLQVFTSDCQSLSYQLKGLKFSEKSMLTYLEQYHQCKDYEYKLYNDHLPWSVFEWWPFAGYQGSLLVSSDVYGKNKLEPASSFSPLIGLSFQFKFPRTKRKPTLFIDVLFSSSQYQSQTKVNGVGGSYTYEYLTLKERMLKMPVGLSLPLHKSRLHIEGGVGLNVFKGDPEFTYESFFDGQVFTEHNTEKSRSSLTNSFFIGLHRTVRFSGLQFPLSLRLDHSPNFTFRNADLTSVYLVVGFKRGRE